MCYIFHFLINETKIIRLTLHLHGYQALCFIRSTIILRNHESVNESEHGKQWASSCIAFRCMSLNTCNCDFHISLFEYQSKCVTGYFFVAIELADSKILWISKENEFMCHIKFGRKHGLTRKNKLYREYGTKKIYELA